jgi:hypothetical protein
VFHFLQKEYKRDLETEIKGKGMQVSADTLDVQRAKRASEMASQVRKQQVQFQANTSNIHTKQECQCYFHVVSMLFKHINTYIATER